MATKAVIFPIILLLIFPASCQNQDTGANVPKFEVDFKWNPPCTDVLKSPEITIGNVPEGTHQFFIELTDLDVPTYDHGADYVKYAGSNIIPPGAVKGTYIGPSPPHGAIHTYEFKVKALGLKNEVLGFGKATRLYPPKGEEEIRWSSCK